MKQTFWKKLLGGFLTFCMVTGLFAAMFSPSAFAAAAPTFTDVPTTHWAFSAVESCHDKGLMGGVGNNTFDPDRLVTKAEMAQTLYNIYSERVPDDAVEIPSLDDVADDAWYRDAAYWGVRSGIVPCPARPGNLVFGETDAYVYSFGPSGTITGRMFAAWYLGKLADILNVDLPEVVAPVTFPDAEFYYLKDADGKEILSERRDLHPEQTAYIYELQRAGIIGGFPDGTFRPDEGLTRAQWAKLIDLYTNIEGLQPAGTSTPTPPAESTPPPVATDWPTFSGPEVWWDSSVYQQILDYAATKEGLVTHVEKSADEVTIYVGGKWPLLSFTELEFTNTGVMVYVWAYFPPSDSDGGWLRNSFVTRITQDDVTEKIKTPYEKVLLYVNICANDYKLAIEAGVLGSQLSPDTKFPWESNAGTNTAQSNYTKTVTSNYDALSGEDKAFLNEIAAAMLEFLESYKNGHLTIMPLRD